MPEIEKNDILSQEDEMPELFVASGGFLAGIRQPTDRIIFNRETTQKGGVEQRLDLDFNNLSGSAGALLQRLVTFTSTDTTPSVANANVFITAGTTAITDFDNGQVGQTIHILATASITITDGAPIILNGSADYDMTVTDTLTLTMYNDQVWSEDSRSVN